MKIALVGYGRMGKIIDEIATERGHEIVARLKETPTLENLSSPDMVIEFSNPEAAFKNIQFCINHSIPVVSGTTGWLDRKPEIEELTKKKNTAFLYGSNFSLGVNLFFALNEQLAKLMNSFPKYQPQLKEIHHTKKKDAPSGTAITLAESIIENNTTFGKWHLGETSDHELGINAERIDDIPGTHHIQYKSEIDDIEIIHTAYNRKGFAQGAVIAAEWLINKKGVFDVKDVIGI